MNFINKKVLLALAFLSIGGSAFGYSWIFTNVTNKILLIEVKLFGWPSRYLSTVKPGRNANFEWEFGNPRAGHCIEHIRLAELSKDILGEELYAKALVNLGGVPENLLHQHPLRETNITWVPGLVWDTFDQKAQDAAAALSSTAFEAVGEVAKLAATAAAAAATGGASVAAEGAAAATVGTAAAAAGSSMLDFSSIFKSLGGVTKSIMTLMEKSKCIGRHFDIVESPETGLTLATKI